MHALGHLFDRFARWCAWALGHPAAFILAVVGTVIWAASGPLFGFSDTWQLVINTGTSLLTFLMVFIVQNSVNRDSAAVQLKLDELIRALEGAQNTMLRIEDLSEAELAQLRARFDALANDARMHEACPPSGSSEDTANTCS